MGGKGGQVTAISRSSFFQSHICRRSSCFLGNPKTQQEEFYVISPFGKAVFRSLLEDLIYEPPEFWKLFSSSHFWCHYIKTAWFPIPLVWAVPNLGLWPEKLIQHKFTWHGRICCLVHKQCGKTRINWMSLVIKSRWCASESPVCLPKKTKPTHFSPHGWKDNHIHSIWNFTRLRLIKFWKFSLMFGPNSKFHFPQKGVYTTKTMNQTIN